MAQSYAVSPYVIIINHCHVEGWKSCGSGARNMYITYAVLSLGMYLYTRTTDIFDSMDLTALRLAVIILAIVNGIASLAMNLAVECVPETFSPNTEVKTMKQCSTVAMVLGMGLSSYFAYWAWCALTWHVPEDERSDSSGVAEAVMVFYVGIPLLIITTLQLYTLYRVIKFILYTSDFTKVLRLSGSEFTPVAIDTAPPPYHDDVDDFKA